MGRNGAGKTTFVRMCATQLLPSSGKLKIFDFDIYTQAQKIRNLISIVPQEGRPLRALTPWDHVYNWLQIRGDNKQTARKKTEEILGKLELYSVKDKPAMNLSGGMKQKILVAMTMATNSQLMFLDEPTIGLDPVSRRHIWSTIQDRKKEGKTILLTTHYMDEAELLSDKIVLIDNGKLIANGTIHDLRKTIPQNIRIDITKNAIDIDILKTYGEVLDLGTNTIRVFTFESALSELSSIALKKNIPFVISPITLDDVFVSLVGKEKE